MTEATEEKRVSFDYLMSLVRHHAHLAKPYVLRWEGENISFTDTGDIVPYFENELNVEVLYK